MEKMDAAIALHLPSSAKAKIHRLAERKSISESEYMRQVMFDHLEQLEYEAKVMADIFDLKGSP